MTTYLAKGKEPHAQLTTRIDFLRFSTTYFLTTAIRTKQSGELLETYYTFIASQLKEVSRMDEHE